ncbi:MAG: hypothetical protein AAF432_05605 [Planctomycetota bacterium]
MLLMAIESPVDSSSLARMIPLVLLIVLLIIVIFTLLLLLSLQRRRTRQRTANRSNSINASAAPDPWSEAGSRLDPPDEPTDEPPPAMY